MRAVSPPRYLPAGLTGWPAGLAYALILGLALLALLACLVAIGSATSAPEPALFAPFRWPPLNGIA